MDHNADEPPDGQSPSSTDIYALCEAIRRTHAQIRLITAANFAAFLELSRSEQRDALLALLNSSEASIEIIDHFPSQNNPDQG